MNHKTGYLAAVVFALACTHTHADEYTPIAPADLLGAGVYINTKNLMEALGPDDGVSLFSEKAVLNCISKDKYRGSVAPDRYFQDSRSFYSVVSNESKLGTDASTLVTLKFTMSSEYANAASGHYRIRGLIKNRSSFNDAYFLSKKCMNDPGHLLEKGFIADFQALPIHVPSPEKAQSWELYNRFLKKYGSHVVSRVLTGSRILVKGYSEEKSNYSENQLQEKLCMAFEGDSAYGSGGLKNCSSVSKKQRQKSESFSIQVTIDARGGKLETRSALLNPKKRNAALVEQFLNESANSTTVVKQAFTPIWDLLKNYSGANRDNMKRAETLRQYFLGYLAYDCSLVKDRGTELRKFAYMGDVNYLPTYHCRRPSDGCHNNKDCSIGGSMGWNCYCYGNSCIKTGSRGNAVLQTEQIGSYDEGVNNTCGYNFGAYCSCDNEDKYHWSSLWPMH